MGAGARAARSTSALLLRSIDYAEADRIVTLLTPDLGKVSALARGARRSHKRFGGALQPFGLLHVELAPTRGELHRLSQATMRQAWLGVLRDLRKMTLGGAVLELIREATPSHHPDAGLFCECCSALEGLDQAGQPGEEWWIAFQIRLMTLQGFAPRLDACGRCARRPRPRQAARFDPRAGSLVCSACGDAGYPLGGRVRGDLQRATRADWQQAASGWTPKELGQARSAVRAFVEARLEHGLAAGRACSQIGELAARSDAPGE